MTDSLSGGYASELEQRLLEPRDSSKSIEPIDDFVESLDLPVGKVTTEARRRNGATKISETELQHAVVDFAKTRGWKVMHTRPAQTRGEWMTPIQGHPGFFDLVLARRGVVLFVELKSDKGKLTRDQEEWGEAVGTATVWRPADWLDGTIVEALT